MKLYIAIPSCRDWKPQFGASLCGLVRKINAQFTVNCMVGTSVLPKARQLAMEHAIENGFTHILFLDDDMAFQADLFDRLSSHRLPIVGANYSNKSPQCNPQSHGVDGKPLSSKDKAGAEEAGWIGFGAVLIDLSVMKDVPKPWFETRWLPERNSFMGEDYYFCGKVREHGIKIYIDHDAKVTHVGDYHYREQ